VQHAVSPSPPFQLWQRFRNVPADGAVGAIPHPGVCPPALFASFPTRLALQHPVAMASTLEPGISLRSSRRAGSWQEGHQTPAPGARKASRGTRPPAPRSHSTAPLCAQQLRTGSPTSAARFLPIHSREDPQAAFPSPGTSAAFKPLRGILSSCENTAPSPQNNRETSEVVLPASRSSWVHF